MSNFGELGLNPLVLRGVEAAGFLKPFPIQEQAMRPLLAGVDVIGQAKTGTGKTAAYSLPLLQALNTQHRRIQAVVLSPTRELALQITDEIKRLGRFTGVNVITIYGGQPINVQLESLRHGVHVVVGTPGRFIDHIKRGTLELGSVKFVVLDECDTMLDMGFIDDVEFILDSMPGKKQLSIFSAMMPYEIIRLSEKYMVNPEKILVDSDEPSVDTLQQFYLVVRNDDKLSTLLDLLHKENPTSTMIFCRTKYGTHRLARELVRRSLNTVTLHGDLSQRQREHSLQLFRSGRADILVATDVAGRGIDIPQVDCVINYEVPLDPALYFHRVGRTARAGGSGRSYTLVSSGEFSDFSRICGLTKAQIRPLRPEDKTHPLHVQNVGSRRVAPAGYKSRRYSNRPRFGGRRRYR